MSNNIISGYIFKGRFKYISIHDHIYNRLKYLNYLKMWIEL